MKVLLMCEGVNEEVILNILLDNDLLVFTRNDLIGLRVYAIRQLGHPVIRSELKHYGSPVKVYRVGDKQNDKLSIPNDLKRIVSRNDIYKYCTKPEFEMLLILSEGLEKEYEKVKSKMSPKSFAKSNIRMNGRKYDQSSEFIKLYYGGCNVNSLIESIKKYKKYKKQHEKDELYLADLLKE